MPTDQFLVVACSSCHRMENDCGASTPKTYKRGRPAPAASDFMGGEGDAPMPTSCDRRRPAPGAASDFRGERGNLTKKARKAWEDLRRTSDSADSSDRSDQSKSTGEASSNAATRPDVFDLDLTDVNGSIQKIWDGVRAGIKQRNAGQADGGLVEGKLYTPTTEDTFIVRINPDKSSTRSVLALFRYQDLYLDSIANNGKWYRFRDSTAKLPEGFAREEARFEFSGSYDVKMEEGCTVPGLDCNVESEEATIKIKLKDFYRCHEILSDMESNMSNQSDIKRALLLLVCVIAESLRFPTMEKWILSVTEKTVNKKNRYVPLKIRKYFRCWGKLSERIHQGRAKYSPHNKFKEVTFEGALELVGIVNKLNLNK